MNQPRTAETAVDDVVSCLALNKSLDDRAILRGIDLTIASGEFVAILGNNGAGKTTLLKMLATLSMPTSGELRLFGQLMPRHAAAARARLGLIGHQSMLYRDLTARENLLFFGRLYGVNNVGNRADELLSWVGMSSRDDDAVRTFSRGMTQRIAIARALIHDPDILLADEPFAGLDVAGADAVERLLSAQHQAGKTVVLVNHDVGQSLRLAQRVLLLRGGRLAVDQPARLNDLQDLHHQLSQPVGRG